jgi:hypothetical protein
MKHVDAQPLHELRQHIHGATPCLGRRVVYDNRLDAVENLGHELLDTEAKQFTEVA